MQKMSKVCTYHLAGNCKFRTGCRNTHGKLLFYAFDSYLLYPVMKLVKPDRWRVQEQTPEVSMVIFIDQDNKRKIIAAKNKAIGDVILFMDGALSRYLSPPRSMHFGSHIEIPPFSPNPEQPLEPTLRPVKNNQSLKFWRVTKDSPEIVELLDRKPTLKALNFNAKVTEIEKAAQGSSKPVSALDDSCKTDKFAAHVLKAHEEGHPRIVCSGSTLSQILNWLMKLNSNCDRPLICFEKFNGSIWAHSLDDGKSLTTQPEENLLFATSVENFFLQDVPKGEYVYASSVIKFGDLNLLTYFEVDGFENGEPIEIKTQNTENLSQTRKASILTSNLFTLKSKYYYLRYHSYEEKKDDSSKYSVKEGSIDFEPSKVPDNIDAYLPTLSNLLHRVLDILSAADVDAVILQFIYKPAKINILHVTKNGGTPYDGWKDDLNKAKKAEVKLNAEDQTATEKSEKKEDKSETQTKREDSETATDEEKPANEQQDQSKHQPAQEEDWFEQVSYKKKPASEPKKAGQDRSNTNKPKKPQESKSNTNQTNNSFAALFATKK